MNLDDFAWRNIPIGPSPETQRRNHEEALRREGDRVVAAVEQGRRDIAAFNEKYGEDLGDSARALVGRNKPSNGAFVYFRGNSVPIDQVSALYAQAFIDAIEAQPKESQVKWVTEFLTETNRFY